MARLTMVVMILVPLLTSCAPTLQKVWLRPDYTPQLWARDSFECERLAQVPGLVAGVPIGGGLVAGVPMGSRTDDQVMARCLEARGWRLTYRQLP